MLWYLFMIIYHISEHLGKFILEVRMFADQYRMFNQKKNTNNVINNEFVT
jgi:hypothetical protein